MLNLSRIQLELERAKEKLRNVEETIQKVEGKTFSNGPVRYGGVKTDYHSDKTRNSTVLDDSKNVRRRVVASAVDLRIQRLTGDEPSFSLKRNLREKREPGLGFKRQAGESRPQGVFARLSGPPYHQADEEDEDDFGKKPTLPSRVYSAATEVPSRQEVIAAQAQDQQSKERNKRMFGALVGTLQKFRKEETRVREREEKRMKVEKKLEEDAKREKEKLMQEKRELFLEKKRREVEIKRIEWSLNRVKEYEAWEANVLPLKNFIQTQAKPHIFYLPSVHNAKTDERLAHSQKLVERMIEKRKTNLKEEIENSEKKARKAAAEDAEEEEAENIPEDNEESCNPDQQIQVDMKPENKENGYFEEENKDKFESHDCVEQNESVEKDENWIKNEPSETKEPEEPTENEQLRSEIEEEKEEPLVNDNKDSNSDLNSFNEEKLTNKMEPSNVSDEESEETSKRQEEMKPGSDAVNAESSEEVDSTEVPSQETETAETVAEKVADSEVTSTNLTQLGNTLVTSPEKTTETNQLSGGESEPQTGDSIKYKTEPHDEKTHGSYVRKEKSPSRKSSRRSKSPRDSSRSKRQRSGSHQKRVSRRGSSGSPPRKSRRSRSPAQKRGRRDFSSRKRSSKEKKRESSSRSSSSVSPKKEKSRSSSVSKSD